MNKAWIAAFLISTSQITMACDNENGLKNLQAKEANKLLENAPSFRHGWEDGKIKLAFVSPKSVEGRCELNMQLELPQNDLDEVNAYLDKNPAKRILLGAQGYSIPESHLVSTPYQYTNSYTASNDGNKPLSDLHHSLEFMYQLLAQLRAEVSDSDSNHQPWTQTTINKELQTCKTKLTAPDLEQACQCRIEKLSQKVSDRQMELVNFILEHPYSAATGSLIAYTELSKNINFSCSLKKR